MIALGSQHNYYLYRPPTDMRKGFEWALRYRDPGDGQVPVGRQRLHLHQPET